MSEAPMIGMNATEVDDLGRFLQAQAASIESIHSQIQHLVNGVVWLGSDATRFTQQWWPEHAARLIAAARQLEDLGQSALNNATEQRRASGEGGSDASPGHAAAPVGPGPAPESNASAPSPSGETAAGSLNGTNTELKQGFLGDWRRHPTNPDMDQWNFGYNESGNCTSYVAWRINQLAAERGLGESYLTNNNVGSQTIPRLGNAYEWGPNADSIGFPPTDDPQPGSVAWWDRDPATAGMSHGHVGVVRSVAPDGAIVIEESAWDSVQFRTTTIRPGDSGYPSGFLNLLP